MMGMSGFQHPAATSTISSTPTVVHRRQRSAEETATNSSGGGTLPRLVRRSALPSVSDESPFDGTYSWIACHQLILSALQGVSLTAEERTKVANSISDMIINQKSMIVEFVKNEIIPHAMENNACKALSCSKKELSRPITDDRIERFSKLWDSFYTSILPNIQSMLYPLEQFESSFNCRKFVLTAFRDRALIPVMRDWVSDDSRLTQLLVVVAIGTNDGSRQYDHFLDICSKCLPGYIADYREETPRKISITTRIERSSTSVGSQPQDEKSEYATTWTISGAVRPSLSTAISVPDGLRSEATASTQRHKIVHWEDLHLPQGRRKEPLSARASSNAIVKTQKKEKSQAIAVSFEI